MDDLISRQDAIEALIQEFYSNVDDYISEKQAVHAIDSLPSAQPNLQPTCNQLATDVISRQAALNIRFSDAINEDGVLYVPLRDFTDGLKALPSAQPERKKSKWVGAHAYCDHLNEEAKANGKTERYLPSGMVIGVYCDQCWCGADKKSDFCPNCGSYNGGESDDKG